MKLEELLGEELYKQVQAKIVEKNAGIEDKLQHIRYADLSEGQYVSKAKHDALQELLNDKTTELDTANNLIADLKKSAKGDEALQGKVTEYESKIAQLQEQLKQTKINGALKVALLSKKALDIDYLTFKINEKLKAEGKKLELDDNENIKDIEKLLNTTQAEFPKQFESAGAKKVEPNPLPKGEERNEAPQSLADALRMQYENPTN